MEENTNEEVKNNKTNNKCTYQEVKVIIARIVEIVLIFAIVVVALLTIMKMIIEQKVACVDNSAVLSETEFQPGLYVHESEDGEKDSYLFYDGYVTYEVDGEKTQGLYSVHSEEVEVLFQKSVEIGGETQDIEVSVREVFKIEDGSTISMEVESAETGEMEKVEYVLTAEE